MHQKLDGQLKIKNKAESCSCRFEDQKTTTTKAERFMSLFNSLRRFFRQQRRQWLQETYRSYAPERRGRGPRFPRDNWDPLYDYDDQPGRRVRREKRKQSASTSLVCSRFLTICVYAAVAMMLAGHISGRRPLKLLQGDRTSKMNAIFQAVKNKTSKDLETERSSTTSRDNIHITNNEAISPIVAQHDTARSEGTEALHDNSDNNAKTPDKIGNDVNREQHHSKERLVGSNESADRGEQSSQSENNTSRDNLRQEVNGDTQTSDSKNEGRSSTGDNESSNTEGNSKRNLPRSNNGGSVASNSGQSIDGRVRDIEQDKFTRYCYMSGVTEDAICVHTPICLGSKGILRLSTNLKCAPYSNIHGIMESLSSEKCTDVEHETEHRAELTDVEQKSEEWLAQAEQDKNVFWYEGETVYLQLSKNSRSTAHFAQRIFFLHHILLHPERYGMEHISNVVIVAERDVVRKIKFHKSWHYGLLRAITHPSQPVFKPKEIEQQVSEGPAKTGTARVFITSGYDHLSTSKQVTCFRRAAIPGALHGQYLLTQEQYPGVVKHGVPAIDKERHSPALISAMKRGKHFDGAMFRRQVFASLDREEPQTQKSLIYLHRTGERSLSSRGHMVLEKSLKDVTAEIGYEYTMVDVGTLSYSEQVDALSRCAIAVGVHGTQLMGTMFMSDDAALLEIFPYKFWHDMYREGCGSGLFYQSMSLGSGDDYAELAKYTGLDDCIAKSRECRLWYRSDDRELVLNENDASEIQRMVREAANEVARKTHQG